MKTTKAVKATKAVEAAQCAVGGWPPSGLSIGLLAPALVMVLASGAKAAVTFDVINATVNAGADHVVGGSDAFPNFRTGAVDNYYPLAHARLDNSPSSEARSSPADTGPVGQTGAATAGQAQPQYADVHYPPGSEKPVTFGQPGGPYAQASATETTAASSATAASTRAAALPGGVGAGARRPPPACARCSWRGGTGTSPPTMRPAGPCPRRRPRPSPTA